MATIYAPAAIFAAMNVTPVAFWALSFGPIANTSIQAQASTTDSVIRGMAFSPDVFYP